MPPISSTMTFSFSCSQWAYIGFYDNNKNAIRVVTADEIKTKPTQHSVKELRSIGIQPDIIILRSEVDITDSQKEKIEKGVKMKEERN